MARFVVPIAIASLISARGWKKGSLDISGAVAAFIVGAVTLGTSPTLGLTLLAFYFSGSSFTRYKSHVKKQYDLDVKGSGGRRTVFQVLCTAGVGAAACVLYLRLTAGADVGVHAPFLQPGGQNTSLERVLLAFLGSFACVAGDTWASELGILSSSPPVLASSCFTRRVPRGTNGGVSAWGTAVSAAGGAAMGAVFACDPLTRALLDLPGSLMRVWGEKDTGAGLALHTWDPRLLYPTAAHARLALAFLVIGAAAGAGGSLVDSLLGATLQRTWYDPHTGRVSAVLPEGCIESKDLFNKSMFETGEAVATGGCSSRREGLRQRGAEQSVSDVDGRSGAETPPPHELVVITGYPFLSNEAVNAVSCALTAIACAMLQPTLANVLEHQL